MNFIESPTTWAVIVSQYLLSGFNKATCQVGTTKNGRDKDSEKDVDNNLQLCALSATGIMYEDVIIICLSPIYGCDKKLEDLIRRLRMLCLLTWFCTNDLQNIEFQNEQPHSYLPLLEEFVT